MARVTIERINDKCDNIFELVVLASYRAHEIDCCQKSLADADNKFAVMALREIEQDKIDIHPATKEQRDLLFAQIKKAGYKWKWNGNKK